MDDNFGAELSRERWTKRKAALALGLNPMCVSRLAGGTLMIAEGQQMFANLISVPISRFIELPDLDSNQEPAG